MVIVHLNKRGVDKVRRGHLWIYKDEVKKVEAEDDVGVANVFFEDEFIGRALYNAKAKNVLKMLTRTYKEIDENFFVERFEAALKRRRVLRTKFRREFNAEGDFIPSLVIDRFDTTFVVQIRSRALEELKEDIVSAMVKVYDPLTIYERSDFESMPEEGLSRYKGVLYGLHPTTEIVTEKGIKFKVDVVHGQKTGFFFDQRDSRAFVKGISFRGGKALDLFTYTGGFALSMASCGMKVDAVDISQDDLDIASQNAKMNKLKVNFINADAFDLKNFGTYDLIIADPPSLVKKKSERERAYQLVKGLVDQILDHLRDGGRFGFCSCAYNIDREMLKRAVSKSASEKGKWVRVLGWTGLPIDHPHLMSMPETDYLKCLWCEAGDNVL